MRWVALVLLAGCVRGGPVAGGMCGVAVAEGLVGEPFVALADVSLPGPLRVLYPGQEVREPAQAARLSASVDSTGRIVRLFCG